MHIVVVQYDVYINFKRKIAKTRGFSKLLASSESHKKTTTK